MLTDLTETGESSSGCHYGSRCESIELSMTVLGECYSSDVRTWCSNDSGPDAVEPEVS